MSIVVPCSLSLSLSLSLSTHRSVLVNAEPSKGKKRLCEAQIPGNARLHRAQIQGMRQSTMGLQAASWLQAANLAPPLTYAPLVGHRSTRAVPHAASVVLRLCGIKLTHPLAPQH